MRSHHGRGLAVAGDGHVRHPELGREETGRPVRDPELAGRAGKRLDEDLVAEALRNRAWCSRAFGVRQPRQPRLFIAPTPHDHRGARAADALGDGRGGQSLGRQQHYAGPLDFTRRQRLRSGSSAQLHCISGPMMLHRHTVGLTALRRKALEFSYKYQQRRQRDKFSS